MSFCSGKAETSRHMVEAAPHSPTIHGCSSEAMNNIDNLIRDNFAREEEVNNKVGVQRFTSKRRNAN